FHRGPRRTDSRLQARDRGEQDRQPSRSLFRFVQHLWDENIRGLERRQLELRRQNTDNGDGLPIQANGPAYCARVPGESPAPESVGNDRRPERVWRFL